MEVASWSKQVQAKTFYLLVELQNYDVWKAGEITANTRSKLDPKLLQLGAQKVRRYLGTLSVQAII
jgi:hypothetical protein